MQFLRIWHNEAFAWICFYPNISIIECNHLLKGSFNILQDQIVIGLTPHLPNDLNSIKRFNKIQSIIYPLSVICNSLDKMNVSDDYKIILTSSNHYHYYNNIHLNHKNQSIVHSSNSLLSSYAPTYTSTNSKIENNDTVPIYSYNNINNLNHNINDESNELIFNMLDKLYNYKLLKIDEYKILKKLTNDKNEYIYAAFDIYETDGQDEEELQDTLLRIARLTLLNIKQSKSISKINKNNINNKNIPIQMASKTNSDGGLTDEEENENEYQNENHYVLNEADPNTSVEMILEKVDYLYDKDLINFDEYNILNKLIDLNHILISAAYEVFETDKDNDEFIDTLIRIGKLKVSLNV